MSAGCGEGPEKSPTMPGAPRVVRLAAASMLQESCPTATLPLAPDLLCGPSQGISSRPWVTGAGREVSSVGDTGFPGFCCPLCGRRLVSILSWASLYLLPAQCHE